MPTYMKRPVCDGYDVTVEGRVLHFVSLPADSDVASTLASVKAAPSPAPYLDSRDTEIVSLKAEVVSLGARLKVAESVKAVK